MRMEIIGPLLLSFVAGMSTLLGSIFIFFKIKKINELIVYSLSLSFVIMILVSIFDLLPESVINLTTYYSPVIGIILGTISFVLGYTTIIILNDKITQKSSSNLRRIGLISIISIILHNFPEGIAVFMSAYSNINIGLKLFIAIILHNIPEGIIISVPLYYSGMSRGKVLKYTLLSGLSEPVGAILGYIILKDIMNIIVLSLILIYVAGLMISLCMNDILKEIIKYNNKKYITLGIISGVLLFSIIFVI